MDLLDSLSKLPALKPIVTHHEDHLRAKAADRDIGAVLVSSGYKNSEQYNC